MVWTTAGLPNSMAEFNNRRTMTPTTTLYVLCGLQEGVRRSG